MQTYTHIYIYIHICTCIYKGDSAPSGRLPVTLYPRSILFERDPGDMSLRGGPGVTYMHYPENKTVFPFGFGKMVWVVGG